MRRLTPWLALLPLAVAALLGYLGSALWTLWVSLTSARTFPNGQFIGLAQYERLLANERWLLACGNLLVYGLLFIGACLVIGFLLAVCLDSQVRAESAWRTVFLYPYALSFVATGLVWQWVFNPESGLQHTVRQWGYENFQFEWIVDPDKALYTIVIASVWQASGLVMALMLAGLRGVDAELWKAARVEGIPAWRVYLHIVLPLLAPTVATAFVLLFTGVVKVFDAVVAMTQGGPGTATDVPAKFIMDHLFGRANIGLASAGAVLLLATVLAVAAPVLYARQRRPGHGGRA